MLRYHTSTTLFLGGFIGLLAFSAFFMVARGYTPDRILGKINQTAPKVVEQVKRDVNFGLAPKETVAAPENPKTEALAPVRANAFNGPLRVNPQNPRYFTDGSGKAIYLTGSHTWSNLQDNGGSNPPPVFDYNQYLNFLVQNNHNFFRLWTWEQARWTLETSDDNYWFNPMPYQRTGPGNALDGQPKFDLTQFNQAYFDRMRERVIAAGDRGIYVSVMLFDGWSIEKAKGQYSLNNPWHGHPFNKNNNINGIDGDPNNNDSGEEVHQGSIQAITDLQKLYVKKVIDTVNDLDNVMYEIANESNNNSEAWQYDMINYIKSYEATKPKQHMVGMTAVWPGGYNPDLLSSPADWVSLNNADGTYMTDPPVADGTKVSLFDTDHLCGICGDRVWVWKSFTRGHNPIFMDGYDGAGYGVGGVGFVFDDPKWVSLRQNLGYTLTYANRMDLNATQPRPDLASTGYCLAKPTAQYAEYLVYLPSGGNVTVDLSAATGSLNVEWFNPQTDETTTGGIVQGGVNRTFQAPFSGDAVLYVFQPSPTSAATSTPTPTATATASTPTPSPTGTGLAPSPTGTNPAPSATGNPPAPTATHTPQPNQTPGNQVYLPLTSREHDVPLVNPAPPVPTHPVPTISPNGVLFTFDANPAAPAPFKSTQWDKQVHSRDASSWYQLDAMQAAHGPNCEAPPATHQIDTYEDAVYQCRNHMMTAINAGGYGVIYLTPDQLVDFSGGEAVIRFDLSTLRQSNRDWVDVWITPFDENLALPLTQDVDLQGAPRDAVHIFMDFGYEGRFKGEVIRNFNAQALPVADNFAYDEVLTPSAMVRSTFELHISANHIKFGMPDYNRWWIDASISNLGWNSGIVQLGHHSYNPTKECSPGLPCAPNTWHWDNFSISTARPFTIIQADQRYVDFQHAATSQVTFDRPAPANSYLRFAGVGKIEVSLNGGAFQPAVQAQSSGTRAGGSYHPEHFSSYWMPIPAGTQTVNFRFSSDDWYNTKYPMIVQDFAIWSLEK